MEIDTLLHFIEIKYFLSDKLLINLKFTLNLKMLTQNNDYV